MLLNNIWKAATRRSSLMKNAKGGINYTITDVNQTFSSTHFKYYTTKNYEGGENNNNDDTQERRWLKAKFSDEKLNGDMEKKSSFFSLVSGINESANITWLGQQRGAVLDFSTPEEAETVMKIYEENKEKTGTWENIEMKFLPWPMPKLVEKEFVTLQLQDGLPSHWNDPKLLVDENRKIYIRPFISKLIDSINRKVCDYPLHPSETPFYDQINTGAVVLDGVAGCGKTTTLQVAVDTFRKAGWLTLHLPSPTMFTEGGLSVRPSKVDTLPNVFDQPEVTVPYLKRLYKLHRNELVKVKVKQDHLKKVAPNLLKLVEHGIRKVVESSFILNAVRQEMSLATEVPVLIAIDEVDSLYLKSIYAYKQVDLWPSNLAGVRPFQIFDLTGLSNVAKPVNGFVLGATTARFGNKSKELDKRVDYKMHKVTVEPFSKDECFNYLSVLMKDKQMAPGVQEVERMALDKLWSISDGCPGELLKKVATIDPFLYPDGIKRLDLATMSVV